MTFLELEVYTPLKRVEVVWKEYIRGLDHLRKLFIYLNHIFIFWYSIVIRHLKY